MSESERESDLGRDSLRLINMMDEWLAAKNRLDIEMYEFMRKEIYERERERARSGSGFTRPD